VTRHSISPIIVIIINIIIIVIITYLFAHQNPFARFLHTLCALLLALTQASAWRGPFPRTHVSAPYASETASTNAARARLILPAAPCRNACQACPQLKRPQVLVGSAFPCPSHRSRRCLLHAVAVARESAPRIPVPHSPRLVQTLASTYFVRRASTSESIAHSALCMRRASACFRQSPPVDAMRVVSNVKLPSPGVAAAAEHGSSRPNCAQSSENVRRSHATVKAPTK
jgi:hypothetical protein